MKSDYKGTIRLCAELAETLKGYPTEISIRILSLNHDPACTCRECTERRQYLLLKKTTSREMVG